jgi:hypothetical protein
LVCDYYEKEEKKKGGNDKQVAAHKIEVISPLQGDECDWHVDLAAEAGYGRTPARHRPYKRWRNRGVPFRVLGPSCGFSRVWHPNPKEDDPEGEQTTTAARILVLLALMILFTHPNPKPQPKH